MPARSTYNRPPPDVVEFITRAFTILKEAGYIVNKRLDGTWMKPGGKEAKDYVNYEQELSDGSVRLRNWHNSTLLEVRRGTIWAAVVLTGPNKNDKYFEIRDSDNTVEKITKLDISAIGQLIKRVDAIAERKKQHALKMARTFNLE